MIQQLETMKEQGIDKTSVPPEFGGTKDDNNDKLFEAVINGNLNLVKELIGTNINVKKNGNTLLHLAVYRGDLEMIKFLINCLSFFILVLYTKSAFLSGRMKAKAGCVQMETLQSQNS